MMRPPARQIRVFAVAILAVVLMAPVPSQAKLLESMIRFHTLKETLAKLLPSQDNLSQRNIALSNKQHRHLKQFKNWDTKKIAFVFYHSKNPENKITRTLILFPEQTRQGTLLVAVALDNGGRVTEALVMEAQEPTLRWVLPLLKADYMKTFTGKDKSLKLKLDAKFRSEEFSPIAQTYALRIANAVKKSAQLFGVFFNREKQP